MRRLLVFTLMYGQFDKKSVQLVNSFDSFNYSVHIFQF